MRQTFQRTLCSLPLFLLFMSSAFAAGDAVDETRDVDPDGYVSINVVRGQVDVFGWDEPEVRIVGTLDEQTRSFLFLVDDDETRIIVELEKNSSGLFRQYEGAKLEVYMPRTSQIEFQGVSTDIDIEGLLSSVEVGVVSGDTQLNGGAGSIEIQSVSGDTTIHDVSGRIKISAVSGDIEVYDSSGEARLTTVSGDIQFFDGARSIELESVSGDIEVSTGLIDSATGHSVSGDIDFAADFAPSSSIEFNSVSGSIKLALGGELDARVRLETGSGSIENELSEDRPDKTRRGGSEELRFSLGNGEGKIRLSSRSGDLVLDSK